MGGNIEVNDTKRYVDSGGPAQEGDKDSVGNWARIFSSYILAKNLEYSVEYSENLSEIELKNNIIICLVKEL